MEEVLRSPVEITIGIRHDLVAADSANQPAQPIGALECLEQMTLCLYRRLDHRCSSLAKHLDGCFRDDLRSEIVLVFQFIENDLEVRITRRAELVDALDGFAQDSPVQALRVVRFGRMGLLESDIENHPLIAFDAVHQTERRIAQFSILENIRRGVERRPLFLPLVGRHTIAVDLELEKVTFELVKPSREGAHLTRRQHETTQSENRARVVLRMLPAHKGTDVTELIQVCDVVDNAPYKHESPHLRTGLGIRAPAVKPERLNQLYATSLALCKHL